MKKLIILFLLLVLTCQSIANAYAATSPSITPTPTSSQSITQIQQQIDNLKDKIASRVAQLKLVEKQGIIGVVTAVSEAQITVQDINGGIHFIDVDELTQFTSPSNKSNFGISDITKNSTLGVLGLYNKDSKRILARFVNVMTLPEYISGAITAIDNKNYTVTVVDGNDKQTIVEIEDITKNSTYSDQTLTKSGFSKMQQGERIYVVGYTDKQNEKEIIASRIIVFPSLPINPSIGALQITPVTSSSPSPTPLQK